MTGQSQQTLKLLLKKFAGDGLFLLSEASEKLKVKESYLLEMINTGKLKAFKIDGHWFVEEKWLEHFKSSILASLSNELSTSGSRINRKSKWSHPVIVEPESGRQNIRKFVVIPVWQFSVSALVLALAVVGVSLMSLSLWPIYEGRQQLSSVFLDSVDGFYGAPLRVGRDVANSKINDERLTEVISSVLRFPIKGQVAGASEIKQ